MYKRQVFVLCEHFSYEMIDTLIYCVRTARRYDDEEMFSRMKEALEMAVSPTSVSYTHLDVYKRQEVESTVR